MQSAKEFEAMTPQAAAATAIQKPVLRRGSRGSAVIELQQLLARWGYYATPFDEVFDVPVENAVKAFQHRVFLVEDGIVGAKTWQGLFSGAPVDMPVLQLGSRGEAVKTVQKVLQLNPDGIFGPITQNSIKTFQTSRNLVADGIVGSRTWFELSKLPH